LQPQLEFSLSPIDEQKTPRINEEMSIIYVPALAKKIKQHMSSLKYMRTIILLMNRPSQMSKLVFNQLEISFHKFLDPVDFYTELYFSKVSNDPVVGMISDHRHKYPLLTNLLLQASYHLKILSNNCMEGVIFISLILTWMHWKYDFN
jgi:hypothetical protein